MRALRDACRAVAERARSVQIDVEAIPAYAASLSFPGPTADATTAPADPREHAAAFWITLNAINFGSGWFPTLRKEPGVSGYHTVAGGLRRRFDAEGPWSVEDLRRLEARTLAALLGQDPDHELMALFASSLNDLGERVAAEAGGEFTRLIDDVDGSAVAFATRLGGWPSFADTSTYDELQIRFLKRAQITAADLQRAGAASFDDLRELTMFADNLVPHVLRLDGILRFDPRLLDRIEREELIEHGSAEEVEIRACALHAVELIAAARPDACAAEVDQLLWQRGGGARYKASPRHRSRCTAY